MAPSGVVGSRRKPTLYPLSYEGYLGFCPPLGRSVLVTGLPPVRSVSHGRQTLFSGITDPVDHSPDLAAGVASGRRSVTCMLLVKAHRPRLRFAVAFGERLKCGRGEHLGAAENRSGEVLGIVAMDERRLVLKVQEEPEFKARVRNSQMDAVMVGQFDGLAEVGVLIAVEDAPDLVVRPASSPSGVLRLGPSCSDSSLDKLKGPASVGIDGDAHAVAVTSMPVDEVHLLGSKAFDERQQFEPAGRVRHPPSGRPAPPVATQLRSPEVMRSAVASNSWRERIGVAP